jgi:cell wall-associated NlpC family hydrolase
MASHRKPRVGQLASVTARTALTLAGAAAASVSVFAHPGHAAPRLTPDEVKSQLDVLYQQAESATQEYDGAVAEAARLQQQAGRLQQQSARTEATMTGLRTRLGALAAAEYRAGGMDPTLRLLTTAHPEDYLRMAGSLSQVTAAQQQLLDQFGSQQHTLRQQQGATAAQLAQLQAEQRRITADRALIQTKLAVAQQLLASLDAAQRAAVQQAASGGGSTSTAGSAASTAGSAAPEVPVSGRAAAAVAFARAQIGKPYVWGATGPGSFDCSGLTQAAWAAAGVALPRTTYEQINAGHRVSAGQLQPGDLVFYYSGVTHVGLYVGGGKIVHAPHPGAAVEYAPVGEMPISGAARPA